MLKLINAKILLAILAALSALGGALVYQRHETEKAAATSARTAAILKQRQKDVEEQRKCNEAFQQQVDQDKKRHDSAAAKEGKTWQNYVP